MKHPMRDALCFIALAAIFVGATTYAVTRANRARAYQELLRRTRADLGAVTREVAVRAERLGGREALIRRARAARPQRSAGRRMPLGIYLVDERGARLATLRDEVYFLSVDPADLGSDAGAGTVLMHEVRPVGKSGLKILTMTALTPGMIKSAVRETAWHVGLFSLGLVLGLSGLALLLADPPLCEPQEAPAAPAVVGARTARQIAAEWSLRRAESARLGRLLVREACDLDRFDPDADAELIDMRPAA